MKVNAIMRKMNSVLRVGGDFGDGRGVVGIVMIIVPPSVVGGEVGIMVEVVSSVIG